MIRYADVVVDLQHGDTGKGKVANYLCKIGHYTHVIRYNGSGNAGHTIYHNGKKVVTHSVPCGVLHGIKSVIGPGCVVSPKLFFQELEDLEKNGINWRGKVFIASNTHVITDEHLAEDGADKTIGTTKRGNGPAMRDKYDRKGVRASDVPELQPFVIDLYQELHGPDEVRILFEGAQGFGLDIDWGDYPYVTSSHCTVGGAILNGVPPQKIRDVWGVAKTYETYVGAKEFEPNDPIFAKMREIGQEYGATTGRPRQCNWLNLKELEKAARVNGVNRIVFNKIDVIEQIGQWHLYGPFGDLKTFSCKQAFQDYIAFALPEEIMEIRFSDNPDNLGKHWGSKKYEYTG